MVTRTKGSRAVRAMAASGMATVVCILPNFLVGALGVQLVEDLGFGEVGLGSASGVFFGTTALTSIYLGRLADRLGAILSLRLAVGAAGVAMLGTAIVSSGWLHLAGWLVLAGCSHGLVQPAANRLLVNRVPPGRLGTAFGFKQSAPPMASMLAGFSVPAIALTVGWRWVYLAGGLLALGVVLSSGRRPPAQARATSSDGPRAPLRDRPTLAVLAAGLGLGLAANASLLTFFVTSSVRAGVTPPLAGALFAIASVFAIATRIVTGISSDRTRLDPLLMCAWLLSVGCVGLVLLASGRPVVMAVAVFVAMIGTWGYPAVLWLAISRAYSDTPGRTTGALAAGSIGGVVGPVVFGALAEHVGYPVAWSFAALAAALSAVAMVLGSRRLRPAARS